MPHRGVRYQSKSRRRWPPSRRRKLTDTVEKASDEIVVAPRFSF
jgi:hypothetical protein